ncbi:MAG: asparagine synthase (glutamine-hydrolyzing) [Planctomycetaceae bacterium]|jgi:asparagine synthase (glutamine-hydrolysing)|nr:asparagine synthase (glutamine-hydrolyzing) [Planctomycetaceae bacterium]
MCGICGAVWSEFGKPIELSSLDAMTDILTHRGPNDRGTYLSCGVALGHRRLSILDLTQSGHQPMHNGSETIYIVFNGEIYNFESLRRDLILSGYKFKSETDTEVIIYLYERYGENFLTYLNGMFAIAIWDIPKRRLILARDRLGKKPLFYASEPNSDSVFDSDLSSESKLGFGRYGSKYEKSLRGIRRLIFASELKSILTNPDVSREIDPYSLDDYLTYQYVPHPYTIFRGVFKLPPAHYAVWQDGDFCVKRYWQPDWNYEDKNYSFEEWKEQLRELVIDAVRIRMRSDVPIGAFLSGGIDSSITAGVMQNISSQPIHTFNIGFEQKEYDESPFASQLAAKFGTVHHQFRVTPDIDDLLPRLIWHYDEPFADSSAIPTMLLCEMTKKNVTVALSGDGGDEMFAGYDRYRAVRYGNICGVLPLFFRRFLAEVIQPLIPNSTRQRSIFRRSKRFLETLAMTSLERYLQWIAIFNRSRRERLYSREFSERILGYNSLEFLRCAELNCMERDYCSRISFVDMQTYLPCDILTKVDIASMSSSLECRSPLLDYRVAELAVRIPLKYKIVGGYGKYILRNVFSDLLPTNIERRRKMGFGVPIDHWFRNELKSRVRDVLLDQKTIERGFFKKEYIQQILNEHFSNQFDHAYRIWSLFVLELWMRNIQISS